MKIRTFSGVMAPLFACLLVASTTQVASALFITTQADVDANSGGAGPKLTLIDTLVSNGKTFTNEYVNGTDLGTAIGAGTAASHAQRTIVAAQVTTAKNGNNFTPVNGPGAAGTDIIAIASVDGGFGGAGPLPTVQFTAGRLGLVAVAAGTFNPNNPETWGLGIAAGAATGFFAEYVLGPQDSVTFNNGDPVVFAGSTMNRSSLDSEAFNEQTQGRFKFLEDFDNSNGSDPGNFITNTPENDPLVLPPGFPGPVVPVVGGMEGLMITAGDVIEQDLIASINGDFTTLATSRSILNAVGIWGLGSVITGGAAGEGFASFGAGQPRDFLPAFAGGFNTSGDFRATNDTNARPAVMVGVPEPASVAIWCVILGFAGLVPYARKKKAAS